MGRLIAAVVVAAGLLLASVPTALAASPSFGRPTATAKFGESIEFRQPVTVDGPIAKAELLITFADAPGPTVLEVPRLPRRDPGRAGWAAPYTVRGRWPRAADRPRRQPD